MLGLSQCFRALLICCVGIILLAGEPPQKSIPRFEEFPSTNQGKKPKATLILTKQDLMYKTRLRIGYDQQPNFAGHYVLTLWGCGALCLMGAAIDTETGMVHWLPGTVCCWDYAGESGPEINDPILFRKDSNLISLTGLLNETGIKGTHYFKLQKGKFIHLLTIPQPTQSAP